MFAAARLLPLLLAYNALAQESSTDVSQIADISTTTTATTPEATMTVSLWLPMGGPDDLSIQASIVTVSPDKTAYALRCKADNTAALCRGYDPPITITEGESTIAFVHTYFRNPEETATLVRPLTVSCLMAGASLTAGRAATSALCTVASEISGLGIMASTTRLASSEIQYMPVTITEGAAKLVAETATPTTDVVASSTAAADMPRITAKARFGLGGAVGVAILANM
ncbi:hypothetical protein TI39_contig614g00013 [Zymoseptoria brevis]|uniref:GPI anchored protein n=1 Tax=Zymoseptoria brevis TaxID=1047168 RepID=A0A0F4GGK1_9PEZI|nr:hypothetical protein TI39_contig614g00013 [Zymoseptoria brevis]